MIPEYQPVTLSADARARLVDYLAAKTEWLQDCHREWHSEKIPRLRRMYDAKPAEAIKNFPWPRASNIVVPLVAIHTNTLHARIMAALFKTRPLWAARSIASNVANMEELREATEKFLSFVGNDPEELDLYRVYDPWVRSTINLGTQLVKLPFEKHVEYLIRPSGNSLTARYDEEPFVRYEGPKPACVPMEYFFIDPQAATEDDAECMFQRCPMSRFELERRKFMAGRYDAAEVEAVLQSPDRTFPATEQREREEVSGVQTAGGNDWAQWDIDEHWCKYATNGRIYSIIATFHHKTRRLLGAVYNFYPENQNVFVAAHLIRRTTGFYSKGFGEELEGMQEQASTQHNQRNDNSTIANTRLWKIKRNPRLNEGMRIYPGAALPVDDPNDIVGEQLGDVYPSSFENEQVTMRLGEMLSGVSPPMQGYGAGVMQGKRGVYTALGTMSMLQEGNRRTDANITDMRYAHTRLGRKLRAQYAHFGIGDRAQLFGDLAPFVQMAFSPAALKQFEIPVNASTASVNLEVERQNSLLLVNVFGTFYQQMIQLMGMLSSPAVPPEAKAYGLEVARKATNLMVRVAKQFEYDDTERYIASIESALGAAQGGNTQVPQLPGGQGAGGGLPQQGGNAGAEGEIVQPFYQSYSGGTAAGLGVGGGALGAGDAGSPQ